MSQVASIPEAVDRMTAIDAALPAGDGVAAFNRMYLRVTVEVGQVVQGTTFEHAEFLERLDVNFANLYLDAYDADVRGERVPAAWAPLFDARRKDSTHPVQFAFAGMNAHINHDLGLAVVSTCREMDLGPEDDTPEHRDFRTTNEVLDQLMPVVKSWFEAGLFGRVDHAAGRVDDAFERWGIAALRAAAWDVSKLVWALDDHPHAQQLFLRSLSRGVETTGHALLI
ncbi:MAG: hypothetical protein JWO12_3560 [Frankiales bacterium]|nr:hypothetical protein [Frankiales bacterium]